MEFYDYEPEGQTPVYQYEPEPASGSPGTKPADQFLPGFYGDTSGADVYDAEGNDYWSPMYEPAGGAATKAAVAPGRWTPGIQPTQPAVRRSPSSGSSASRYYPTSKSSTSITESIMPSGPTPSVDLPDFNAPEWDEGKISELSRKAAGPFVGGLRRGLNRTLVSIRSAEKNPVARAQMYRQAMEGFGGEQGLGGVLSRARRQGRAEYGQQYNYEYQEAVQKTNQLNLEAQANFNAAMMIYQAKIGHKTTSTSTTGYSQLG